MKILRYARFNRLMAALALGALTFALSTPHRVSANTCGFRAHYIYYAEPEKINVVGTCDNYCGNHAPSCTGTTSPYSTRTFYVECTFC
jgi:hypothetical protein